MKCPLLRIALALVVLLSLVTLAGCGGLAATKVNLPVPLNSIRVWAGAAQPGFHRQAVNEKASGWRDYEGFDLAIDSARIKATLTNRTGDAANPSRTVVHVYVSDQEYSSADAAKAHAVLLMDVVAPAGQAELSFDSSFVAVSYEAGAIMRDGVFWVYAVGADAASDVEMMNAEMTLKARVWLL